MSSSSETVRGGLPLSELQGQRLAPGLDASRKICLRNEVMKAQKYCLWKLTALALNGLSAQARAIEIRQYIEAGNSARIMENASGITISDEDVVYVTAEERGTLFSHLAGQVGKLLPLMTA